MSTCGVPGPARGSEDARVTETPVSLALGDPQSMDHLLNVFCLPSALYPFVHKSSTDTKRKSLELYTTLHCYVDYPHVTVLETEMQKRE